MKLFSWNVNGIRAAEQKGYSSWFQSVNADVIGLQEVKAHREQVPPEAANPKGYEVIWNAAKKPGYSGTAVFSRLKPLSVQLGWGIEEFDSEGRVITVDYGSWAVVNAYFPNSQRDAARLDYKLRFCDTMLKHLNGLRKEGKEVVLCGDYNIAHQEIDLKNPKQNEDNAGFLPEERAWMTAFLKQGYVDIFRERVKEGGHYTWWSYRPGIRDRNIGWRIDYHCISPGLREKVVDVGHQPQVKGSDHCPVWLELRLG